LPGSDSDSDFARRRGGRPCSSGEAGSEQTANSHRQKNNAVHILIDGKEIVLIDAAGLHVHGNLTYTGTESDLGTSNPASRK